MNTFVTNIQPLVTFFHYCQLEPYRASCRRIWLGCQDSSLQGVFCVFTTSMPTGKSGALYFIWLTNTGINCPYRSLQTVYQRDPTGIKMRECCCREIKPDLPGQFCLVLCQQWGRPINGGNPAEWGNNSMRSIPGLIVSFGLHQGSLHYYLHSPETASSGEKVAARYPAGCNIYRMLPK